MSHRIARPDTAFSMDARGKGLKKRPRVKADDHLAWIRTLPCLITGKYPVEACHVRYHDARFGKPAVGMGEKPDDKWVVPMIPEAHREQHSMNERKFWYEQGIDPVLVAAALWASTGDDEAARIIIEQNRRNKWLRSR